jgi:hypothetical protein
MSTVYLLIGNVTFAVINYHMGNYITAILNGMGIGAGLCGLHTIATENKPALCLDKDRNRAKYGKN